MAIPTSPFDASRYLTDEAAQRELLLDAFETEDPRYIANALGVVAKARGMTKVAKSAGVTREALYKALSEDGDPKLTTVVGVMKALGLHLTLAPDKERETA